MEYKICMSIAEIDPSFAKMTEELKKVAEVDVMGLDGFSLAGYDIFIGKKMTTKMLETADRLKVIFAYKTGVDDFPLEELEKMMKKQRDDSSDVIKMVMVKLTLMNL